MSGKLKRGNFSRIISSRITSVQQKREERSPKKLGNQLHSVFPYDNLLGGMRMDKTLEKTIRMFKKQLFEAYFDWLKKNRETTGERWYKKLKEQGLEAKDCNSAVKIIGVALWMFNMTSNFGVLAGIGPNDVKLHEIHEKLDERSTKRLLTLVAACLSLQYLPPPIGKEEIPVISPKRFSLKLWVEQYQH